MALDDPYVELSELKARLGITGTGHDDVLTAAILAASRAIDGWTGRRFTQSAAATSRFFTARGGSPLLVDDLVSVSALATDDGVRTYATVWETADYDLAPFDAAEIGRPYTEIMIAPTGRYRYPRWPMGVRVTAVWGWPAVPAPIREATALEATRLWKRKDAPFGVTGSPELGQLQTITRVDPDVQQLIAPYKRMVMF